jgi:uncharacterized protein (TIGR02246 family)
MSAHTDTTKDEAEIRALVENMRRALHERDAEALAARLAPDVLVYDLAPPLRSRGAEIERQKLRAWLATKAGPIGYELRDLCIEAGGAVAFSTGLARMRSTGVDGDTAELWLRTTSCYRKREGRWEIAHQHESVPFHMDGSLRAAVDLHPESVGSEADTFVIARVFDAPRDLVWKAWTEVEHLKRWWGPKGSTVAHCAMDLRPGGTFHYCLQAPDGSVLWGRWVFREIAAPERLVSISAFSDEKGGLTRPPWGGDWPPETHSAVSFADKGGGRTEVTVAWVAETGTEADRAAFAAGFDSMRQGWSGTFDQLGDYLAKR